MYRKVVSFRLHTIEITIYILYIFPPFCGFKALTFGLLKYHTVWDLMHITSKISNVHDGNNKDHIGFYIYFAFYLKKNAAEVTAMICAAYGENAVSHIICKR